MYICDSILFHIPRKTLESCKDMVTCTPMNSSQHRKHIFLYGISPTTTTTTTTCAMCQVDNVNVNLTWRKIDTCTLNFTMSFLFTVFALPYQVLAQ